MRRLGILSVVMIAGLVCLPRAAASQSSTSAGVSTAAAALALVTAPSAFIGLDWSTEVRGASGRTPRVELPQVRNRRGIPFMIAGGAMFLAGAIVGGDGGTLLLLGGVGVGAYGAYVYFGS
jgi:hypothetical protein